MTGMNHPDKTRYVRVEGREDLGEIMGTINFGNTGMIRCFEVYFDADGLCAVYAAKKVTQC